MSRFIDRNYRNIKERKFSFFSILAWFFEGNKYLTSQIFKIYKMKYFLHKYFTTLSALNEIFQLLNQLLYN